METAGGNASTGKGIGYASVIAVDSSGNYYQAGLTEGDVDGLSHSHKSMPGYCTNWSSHPHDLFIRKYNSSHVLQWTKLYNSLNGFSYAGGDGVYDFANVNIALSNDGTQLFVGTAWAGTINGQTSACQGWRNKQCLLLFSLDTSDGSFNWTKWPDQAEIKQQVSACRCIG